MSRSAAPRGSDTALAATGPDEETTLLPVAADLAESVAGWQGWLATERRASPHTLAAYQRDLRSFLFFLSQHLGGPPDLATLAGIGAAELRAWLAERLGRGLAQASSARALAVVRGFFRYLARQGVVTNPATLRVRSARRPPWTPRALDEAGARQLLDAAAGAADRADWVARRDVALLSVLYGCGLRLGEALALNRNALDGDGPLRIVGKGRKERQVPVLPVIRRAIAAYVSACPFAGDAEEPLFVGVRGKRLDPGVAQRRMRELRAQLGLGDSVTPHAMRHSFATHLLARSGDLRGIQELLGHAQLSTTQRYTRIDPGRLVAVHQASHPRDRTKRPDSPNTAPSARPER